MTSRPTIQDSNNIREVVTNFDSRVLVTSNSKTNTNTGEVTIYTYDSTQKTWLSQPVTLTGPSTNSYFGSSIDINWDGTRVVIGANALARAYVYDYNGGSWSYNSNILQSDTGSDFGFSVSISKDDGNTIAVGAPQHNNVYIYEMLNDTNWTVSNVLNGSSIQNIVGYDSTSNLVLISEYNRYGENVKLSGYGDYIIIGQPGTILSNIFPSDATNFGIVDAGQKETDGSVSIQPWWNQTGEYFLYFKQLLTRQEGSVQVFKTDNNWYLSNSQVGSTLYGERNCLITDNSRRGEGAWSSSGFGLNVDISLDGGVITIAAPLFSINGGNYQYHNGQMYTYTFDSTTNDWIRKNSFIGSRQALLGLSFTLDYLGNRMGLISRNHAQGSSLRVLDWNGIEWYDTKPPVNFGFGLDFDFQKVTLSDGENIFFKVDKSVYTYKYVLTQIFEGNSLFSGYVSTPQLFVGTNDGDFTEDNVTMPAPSKIIAFGGTYGENTYNSTTIENRVYASFGNIGGTSGGQYEHQAGRSELLIAKTFSDEWNKFASTGEAVDYIRLKAAEVRIDSHDFINQTDDKYDQTPVFVANYRGNIGIRIPDVEPYDKYFRSRTKTKANLDVNGSVYMRNKLTINAPERSTITDNDEFPIIIWDTRDVNIISSGKVYSNIVYNGFFTRSATVSSSGISYSPTNFAFYFTTSSGKIETDDETGAGFNPTFSFWIKLTKVHNSTNYPTNDKIVTIGNVSTSQYGSVNLTPTGIEIDFNNRASIFSNTITFTTNTWYHINARLPTAGNQPSLTNCILSINNVDVTLSQTNTTTADYDGSGSRFTLGNGIKDAYIGMVVFGEYNNVRKPLPSEWYNYGPPDEILAVGGSATIAGKLGVGVTNPTEALEVSGNVHANYFVGDGSRLTNLQGVAGGANTLQEVTDEGSSTNQTLYLTNTATSLVASGNVHANYFIGDGSQLTNIQNALQDELQYSFSSGTYTINPYTDNQYVIQNFNTQSGSDVTIVFTYFVLENTYDLLDFYNDSELDIDSPPYTFTGFTTPSSFTFNVPTGQWKVRFRSDTSVSGGSYGFSFNWYSNKRSIKNLQLFGASEPSIIFGSNTTYGGNTQLRVGSGSLSGFNTQSGYVVITNGNLHLDPCAGHDLFLCYYNGGNVQHSGSVVHTSDDRLKSDEKIIENATETLNKLVPQTYLKSKSLENPEISFFEAGLIAQEIYYKCPELRHIVKLPKDAEPAESIEIPDDPQIDPDYSSWGTSEAAVNYTGLIPYMITAIQELDKKNKSLEVQLTSVLARLDALENPP
jgi:hypothetical protein